MQLHAGGSVHELRIERPLHPSSRTVFARRMDTGCRLATIGGERKKMGPVPSDSIPACKDRAPAILDCGENRAILGYRPRAWNRQSLRPPPPTATAKTCRCGSRRRLVRFSRAKAPVEKFITGPQARPRMKRDCLLRLSGSADPASIASSAFSGYSGSPIGVERRATAKWLFHQEKTTLSNTGDVT